MKLFKLISVLVFGFFTVHTMDAQYSLTGPSTANAGETKDYYLSGTDIAYNNWSVNNGGTVVSVTYLGAGNGYRAQIRFNNDGPTRVSCQVGDEFNNVYNLNKRVTVCNVLNSGSITGTQTVCYAGNPTTLGNSASASGGDGSYTYSWQYSPNNSSWYGISGATSATYDPPSGETQTKWYRRRVSSCSQTKYTSTVKVTIRSDLSPGSLAGSDFYVCSGGDPRGFLLSSSPSGSDGNYTNQWQYSNTGTGGWTNISGATGATYDPPSGLTTDRWYRKRVQSCGRTKYTNVVKVNIHPGLTAGTINGTQTICYSGNPSIFGNASSPSGGSGLYNYQWQFSTNGSSGWTNISGATGATYDAPGNLISDRWYRRQETSCETKYSNIIKVTVRPPLVAGSINGTQTVCYSGDPSTLGNSASASGGNGSYTYTWEYSDNGSNGWTIINGATSTTYNPPGGLINDRWYRRSATSCSQTLYTSSVKVTVRPDLTPGSINGAQSICEGGNPTVLGNVSIAGGGNGSYSYQWQYSTNGSSGWSDISGATGTSYDPPNGLNSDRWYRREVVSCSQTKYTSSIKITAIAPTVWYADTDGDGFGDPSSSISDCSQPSSYVNNSSDYDDSTTMITNIAPQTFYLDKDGDGFGESIASISASFQPLGYTDNTLDQCPDVPGSNNGCDYQSPVPSDENYIYSRTYQTAMSSSNNIKSNREVLESINYYDGLGRPMQQIAIKGSLPQSNSLSPNYVPGWTMDWQQGVSSTNFFNRNGQASENEIISGPDPFGNNSLIWACGNDPGNDADGGWNTDYFSVDRTKTYRYMVWVRRNYSQNGTTYHGTQNVNNLNGVANGNPYFWSGDLPQLDEWYLLVGIIHPYTYSGGDTGVSGVYDILGNKVIDGTEFKWDAATTTSRFRSYLYYATDVNVRQYFHQPILEIVDGNEVSLQDMFQGLEANDIVTHVGYDNFGRTEKEWLPYVATTGGLGTYRAGAEADTDTYYLNNYGSEMGTMPNPFSQKELESSPLSRVLKQAAPGEDWQLGNGREIDFEYVTNIAQEVRLFSVTTDYIGGIYEPTLVDGSGNAYYNPGELYKNITKDENHNDPNSKLHTTEEFTDKQGRVVLKRTYAEVGSTVTPHDTYYVYDNFGNLTYVISPKVDTTNGVSSIELDELCYQYGYDAQNRLVKKRIPGKGWEYMVYNKMNQPVMTTDPILSGQGKWLFTRYDGLGRVAFTGIVNGGSRETEQAAADNVNVQWAEQSTTPTTVDGMPLYYNTNGYPTLASVSELHTINYYDNYNATRDGLAKPTGQIFGQAQAVDVKGLPTAAKIRVLETNQWITNLTVYDVKGRPIWVKTDNPYLGTNDIVKTELDFTGKIEQQQSEHTKNGNATIVTSDSFYYDDQGRLLSQKQTIGTQPEETLVNNGYDPLGQLNTKKVGGGLQTVDYTYNVRGWLKQINNPTSLGNDLFAFGINYNQTQFGGAPIYNGNIAETYWKTSNDGVLRRYRYEYDALNRLQLAAYNLGDNSQPNRYSESGITYDRNGNILTLQRMGHTNSGATTFDTMDNLIYTYDDGNKLSKVADSANDTYGFVDGTDVATEYSYDANGNMVSDANKGITGITYNHLNLPTTIGTDSGNISYVYDAMGIKLEKTVSVGSSVTSYAGNYVYQNSVLQFMSHPEGYATPNGMGGYDYVYQYKDHLGNIRLSYTDDPSNPGTPTIIEESNYYPFGLKHKGYNGSTSPLGNDVAQKWKFGGKEYDESLGLETYDFGARNYDPALGRWMNIDPLAEQMRRHSPYNYAFDNPVVFTDPDGMAPFTDLFDKNGNKIGDDGVNNGVNIVVENEELAEQVQNVYKKEGTVDLMDDRFSFSGDDIDALPSDAAFGEALNVLDKTIENGGLSEESSLVYNNGQVVQGPQGEAVQLGVDSHAETSLPGLFPGTTPADVEVSIHSHPTEAKVVGDQVFGGNATEPTNADAAAFAQFGTNIIVGPLGQANATQGIDKQTGKNTTTVNKPKNGVVIYKNGGTVPSYQFSRRTVNKIIGN